jgi:hypothetical protein
MSVNDVYTYTPKQHHCHEGLAIEDERGNLIDWFWGNSRDSMLDKHVRRDAEDLKLIANLGDYELTPRDGRESNREYAPNDRLVITSQHGLQRTYYIRKGAMPDLPTRIENARYALREAESAASSAKFQVEYAQSVLAELVASAAKERS